MTLEPNKNVFTFIVKYYSKSGAYIRCCEYNYAPARRDGGCPHMPDVAAHLRGLWASGGQEGLPGRMDPHLVGFIYVARLSTRDREGDSILIPPIRVL